MNAILCMSNNLRKNISSIRKSLQSPFYFMVVNIVYAKNPDAMLPTLEYLSGSTVSSLYRLRDIDNTGTTILFKALFP